MELKPILGLLIASAIPIVMFALWCEYFRNDISSQDTEEETIADQTLRVRIAGLISTLAQLFVFLATSAVRQESASASVAGLLIALSALIAQRSIQFRLEREILPKAQEADSAQKPAQVLPSNFLWAFAGMALYMGLLFGCVFSSAAAVAIFHIKGIAALSLIGFGSLFGFTLALASNFALSSWFFKKMVPSELVSDAEIQRRLERPFSEAGIPAPEFRRIAVNSVKSANAWVTGFPSFSGPLRPVLWLTPHLYRDFQNPDLHSELEAILKHEAAHMRLGHLAQRLRLAWMMSLTVLVTLAVSLALNAYFRSQQMSNILPLFSMTAAIALVVFSFRSLQRQAQRHELEADRYAVEGLGASAISLISALRRIDEWNAQVTQSELSQSTPTFGSHPAIEERIAALRPLAEKESTSTEQFKIAA